MNNEIKDDFLLLIRNQYPYVKNTRGNEYATYEDFEERYIKYSTEDIYLPCLLDAFLELTEKEVSIFTWITSSWGIQLHCYLIDVLKMDASQKRKEAFLRVAVDKMDVWTDSTYGRFSKDEKNLILKELSLNNVHAPRHVIDGLNQ